jgi:hypothetical protein
MPGSGAYRTIWPWMGLKRYSLKNTPKIIGWTNYNHSVVSSEKRKWGFSDGTKQLSFLSDTKIVRHIKLKLDMNPHLNKDYFALRKSKFDELKNNCKPEIMTMTNNCCPNKGLIEA